MGRRAPVAVKDDDGGIGRHLGEKGLGVLEIDVVADVVVPGDEPAEGRAILVLGKTIGTDERQRALWREQVEPAFEEGYVEIGAVGGGGPQIAVLAQHMRGNVLQAQIGRVSDDEIEALVGPVVEEKVGLKGPGLGQLRRPPRGAARVGQKSEDELAGFRHGPRGEVHGGHGGVPAGVGPFHLSATAPGRFQKARNDFPQEGPVPAGRFQQAHANEPGPAPVVSGQIENQRDHLGLGVHTGRFGMV
jgi:hypothetical protein